MGKEIIEAHKFDEAKKGLKAFSDESKTTYQISKVKSDGGLFGLGNHKVTGTELNGIISQIQNYLINANKCEMKIIEEFGEVYNTFEALDKEYIQSILISIESAKKANSKAVKAQEDINKTITVLSSAIEQLSQFKEKLESLEHLGNVDELYSNLEKLSDYVNSNLVIKEAYEAQVNEFNSSFCKINELMNLLLQKSDFEIFTKKNRLHRILAYCFIGVTFSVSIVDLILNIIGIF